MLKQLRKNVKLPYEFLKVVSTGTPQNFKVIPGKKIRIYLCTLCRTSGGISDGIPGKFSVRVSAVSRKEFMLDFMMYLLKKNLEHYFCKKSPQNIWKTSLQVFRKIFLQVLLKKPRRVSEKSHGLLYKGIVWEFFGGFSGELLEKILKIEEFLKRSMLKLEFEFFFWEFYGPIFCGISDGISEKPLEEFLNESWKKIWRTSRGIYKEFSRLSFEEMFAEILRLITGKNSRELHKINYTIFSEDILMIKLKILKGNSKQFLNRRFSEEILR